MLKVLGVCSEEKLNSSVKPKGKGLSNKWIIVFSLADGINCENLSTYEKFAELLPTKVMDIVHPDVL